MNTLTVSIDEKIKNQAQIKAKNDGVTLTFVVVQALKAYNEGKMKFGMIDDDDEIVASYDVTTKAGKKACIEGFKKLIK
jgi:hypothetical protein